MDFSSDCHAIIRLFVRIIVIVHESDFSSMNVGLFIFIHRHCSHVGLFVYIMNVITSVGLFIFIMNVGLFIIIYHVHQEGLSPGFTPVYGPSPTRFDIVTVIVR